MGVRRRLRVVWRRAKYSPRAPNRKQTLTFGLVAAPVGLYWLFGKHWAIALLTAAVGVLLSTDYRAVDEYVSSSSYQWIQNTETLLEAVEQNHYAEQDHDPFELTYWKNGHFRATVRSDRVIQPGMRFLIQCDVTSQDGQITFPVAFCTAKVGSVSAESDGKREVKLNLVRWLEGNRAGNQLDREVYREKSRKLRTGSDELAPTAVIDESAEMNALTPSEWETLVELLDRTEIHEAR